MPADDRYEVFSVNQFLSAMKGVLKRRATADEVHKLLGQRLPSQLFNERLQTPAVTGRECESPEVAAGERDRLKHPEAPLNLKLTELRNGVASRFWRVVRRTNGTLGKQRADWMAW